MRNRVKWGNSFFIIYFFFPYKNVTENFKTRKSEYNYNLKIRIKPFKTSLTMKIKKI